MKLKDYLHLKNMTQKEFSSKIGYTSSYVNRVIKGIDKPSGKFVRLVEIETKGNVTKKDILNPSESEDLSVLLKE